MLKFFINKSVAFLAVAIVPIATAHAAADVDALGKSDTFYGVIGLAPLISFTCVGVNAGVWQIFKRTSYLGTIAVSAVSNAASAATTVQRIGPSILASSSYSRPEAGSCTLLGLINPTPTDYRLTLSANEDIEFVAGNSANVKNVAAQLPPAIAGKDSGVWGSFTLVSATPNLESDGSLVWRVGMSVSVNAFRPIGFNGYERGGYVTQSAARATVGAVDTVTSSPP